MSFRQTILVSTGKVLGYRPLKKGERPNKAEKFVSPYLSGRLASESAKGFGIRPDNQPYTIDGKYQEPVYVSEEEFRKYALVPIHEMKPQPTMKQNIVEILRGNRGPMSLRDLSTDIYVRQHEPYPNYTREMIRQGGYNPMTGEKEGYTEIAAQITGSGALGQLVKQGVVKKAGRGLYELDEEKLRWDKHLRDLYEHYAVDRNP